MILIISIFWQLTKKKILLLTQSPTPIGLIIRTYGQKPNIDHATTTLEKGEKCNIVYLLYINIIEKQ